MHKLPFSTAHFDITTAQIVINCTLKYAPSHRSQGKQEFDSLPVFLSPFTNKLSDNWTHPKLSQYREKNWGLLHPFIVHTYIISRPRHI